MTTLIIIASLTLNMCLIAIAIVLYSKLTNTVKTRGNQLVELQRHIDRMMSIYEPYKRTIEGRMALGTEDIGRKYIDNLRENPDKGLSSPIIEYVIKEVAKQIATVIEMELKAKPQYMKITHKTKFHEIFIDWSFPFILYPGREKLIEQFSRIVKTAPDHFTKPPIINKHF